MRSAGGQKSELNGKVDSENEDDHIGPFPTTGARLVKLLKHGMLKSLHAPAFLRVCTY